MKKIFTILFFASSILCNAQWTHSGPEYYDYYFYRPFIQHNSELWTVGTNEILKSNDNGVSWSPVCNIPARFNDIAFINNSILAVGDYLYRSMDNGNTWQNLSIPYSATILKKLNSGRLILGTGPYYSDDEGNTWIASSIATIASFTSFIEINNR